MSSASRVPGESPPETGEEQPKRPASPGRYSLSTEGSTQMAAVRIDSTRSMAAVRPPGSAAPAGASPAVGSPGAPGAPGAPAAPATTASAGASAAEAPPPSLRGAAPAPITVPPPLGSNPPSSRRGTLPQGQPAMLPDPPPAPAPAAGTVAAALASARPGALPPTKPSFAPASATARSSTSGSTSGNGNTGPSGTAGASSSTTSAGSRRPPPPPSQLKPQRAPSVRPGPLGGAAGGGSGGPPFDFEGFDEGSIAAAFDELLSEGSSGLVGTDTGVDLAPVRELFAELAANHMRHVRDFMIDVKWGEAPREWIEICIPAVASLRRAAERLEIPDLATGLDAFATQLKDASVSGERTIVGDTKEKLLASYDGLVAILPTAFALDRDKSQREAVIIQSLCLSVPDVRKVTIDKLHAAGLTSLHTLFEAKADEVAQVAGIPETLAARIVERFQAYRRELQNASPQDARAAERERLAALTASLKEQHVGYEEAASGWSPEAKAKKRDLFRSREETWLSISLLLARFGEVERIQGIERVPFSQRITQLTEYLEEAKQKYRSE